MTAQASKRKTGLPNNQELNQMSNDDLRSLLAMLRENMMGYKGSNQSASPKPVQSTGVIRQTRITIARVLTILQKRHAPAVINVT